MGFSFFQIDAGLRSKQFSRHYQRLKRECLLLKPFPDPVSLIAFFHAPNGEYLAKDRILSFLVEACRREGRDGPTALLFLALFRPAIAAIYKLTRKRWREIDDREFVQEICLCLLEILRESRISHQRVAAQIVGRLKNRIRSLVNQKLKQTRFEVSDGREDRHPSDQEGLGWEHSRPGRADASHWPPWHWGNVPPADEPDVPIFQPAHPWEGRASDGWDAEGFRITDAEAFLGALLRKGLITEGDRQILTATIIEGRCLKAMTPKREHYHRDRQRRRRLLLAIRAYLLAGRT
ncbi:MAG: hypothetical protein QMD32_04130 [Smithellaceae bacterium]|nr:hypothetical protein [Smithellaceae bacterium]